MPVRLLSLIDDSSIRDREIERHDYGGLGITACPEWHNPAVFIAWIEENIGPRPEQRYLSGCLAYTPGRVDNDKK
jgi:hypothetical protein